MKLQAIRIDRNVDNEIYPPFSCFACQDGGLAGGIFLAEFVDGNSDIPFICNREQCEAGRLYRTAYAANNDKQYRASFDSRLDKYACEDMHQWGLQAWRDDLKNRFSRQPPTESVAQKFAAAVSDRDRKIENIKDLLMQIEFDIAPRLEAFVQKYRDRDQVNYPNWQSLPSKAHEVLITNLRSLIA